MTRFTKSGAQTMDDERHSKKRKTAGDIAVVAATPGLHTNNTTNSARDAVISTPELLENIISCLPPRDILTVTLHGVHMRWEEARGRESVRDTSEKPWSSPTLYFGSHSRGEYNQPSFGPSRTWRDAYLTQPPITTGILDLHPGDFYLELLPPTNTTICAAVREQSGITLGLLHDTIFAAL
ncbi:hypothetical protein Q7P35_011129 [Cladosporium inversicolor]